MGTCEGLPPLGEFQDITPLEFTSAEEAIAVNVDLDPQHPGTVYASVGTWAGHRGFFRSEDCGASWTKLDSGQNADAISSGFQWSMAIDPGNGKVLYAANGYGSPPALFKSVNGGEDWTSLFPYGSEVASVVEYNFTQAVSMDPTNPRHLAVTFHANCTGEWAPICMAETRDAGEHWTLFHAPGTGWSEGAGPVIVNDKVILHVSFDALNYTEDLGAHWEKVADNASGQLYHSPVTGKYYLGSNKGVLTSTDAHSWSTIPNSPISSGIIGTGKNLYTTSPTIKNDRPFRTAKESDPSTWTTMPSQVFLEGGAHLAYDADHKVLYSGNYTGRLSRVVVE